MNGAMTIAASGMAAASMSLAASASNLANSQTAAPVPADGQNPSAAPAYQPVTVSQSAAADGGVNGTIVPESSGSVLAYDPSSPFANLQGMILEPNVDPATEIVNQMSASLAYKANLASFKAAEEMENTALDALA